MLQQLPFGVYSLQFTVKIHLALLAGVVRKTMKTDGCIFGKSVCTADSTTILSHIDQCHLICNVGRH